MRFNFRGTRVGRWLRKHWFEKSLIALVTTVALFLLFDFLFPFKVKDDYSTIVLAADGSVLHAFLNSEDKWRMKTGLNEITPLLRKTILFKEDKWFYYHLGVNPIAMAKALVNNLVYRRKTSGASTITMQTVRLLEPRPRTVLSKAIEIVRALQLELHYSKDEILQLYLNHVPYGSNVEGVKAASIIYFRQNPDYLSLAQIVTLAVVPNKPSSLVPGKHNEALEQQRNKWLKKIKAARVFPDRDVDDALYEPVDIKRNAVPKLAPHLALRLRNAHPGEAVIRSTIKPATQVQTENIVYNYVQRMRAMNVSNAAVLVVDNKTHDVQAYCGSADFYNSFDQGQVDGIRAMRSPGSTLKPFLYALCFDKGIVTPLARLDDVPCDYQGYRPKNFDNKFNGSVTVEEALSRSLNVPAVGLMSKLGAQTFNNELANIGFSDFVKRKEQLGLSAILGGCGVTLEELVNMYAMLACNGVEHALRWTSDDTDSLSVKGCTPAAAYMVTKTLTQLTRPDLPNNFSSSYRLPKVAWKTGTSYGRRDAWSIGYNDRYTIGVWVGNFDGTGVPELTGAEAATPLLFELFNTLDYNGSASLRTPDGLDLRTVCSASGMLPNEFCTDLVTDCFIPGVSTNALCNHLKPVAVSADETISYCAQCKPEAGYKTKLYPNLSPELLAFYDDQHVPYDKIPLHNPACSNVGQGAAPGITSPLADTEYLLEKNGSRQIRLSCNAANDVALIYWYVNDQFFKSAKSSEALFFQPPTSGYYKISCADDKGRNANISIRVTML